MQRPRGPYPGYYGGYGSPKGYGSSGEEGFRSPRPQFQSSPRGHHPQYQHYQQQQHQYTPTHNQHGLRHPGISPISHGPTDMSRGRHPSMPSPGMHSTPNYRGGRGGRGRFYSGGHSPRSPRDCNPGGSDDISMYFHPSMLEDPWARLDPIPVSTAQMTAAT